MQNILYRDLQFLMENLHVEFLAVHCSGVNDMQGNFRRHLQLLLGKLALGILSIALFKVYFGLRVYF